MGSGNGRGSLTISCAVAPARESLKKPDVPHLACPDRQPLPLSRQRPHPGTAAAASRLASARRFRPTAAMPSKTVPAASIPPIPEVDGEGPFPDADAGRMAGGAAHPVRRCQQRPDHPPGRRDRGPGQSRNGGRPRRHRAVFRRRLAGQIKGPPKVLTSPGHSFSDVARKVVSIINLGEPAGDREHGRPAGASACGSAPTSMSRAGRPGTNSICSTTPSSIGAARLKVVKRITRCAATNVDPDTAARDLEIPQALMRRLGHNECGDLCRGGRGRRDCCGRYDRAGAADAAVGWAKPPGRACHASGGRACASCSQQH